jgi:hypothetical protein
MQIPDIYLCTMDCGRLRAATVVNSTTSLEDLCVECMAEWDRTRAAHDRHAELKDLVWRLADTDQRAVDLKRILQLVVEWPELVEELRDRLAVATVGV